LPLGEPWGLREERTTSVFPLPEFSIQGTDEGRWTESDKLLLHKLVGLKQGIKQPDKVFLGDHVSRRC
jgi:hypothetical protein